MSKLNEKASEIFKQREERIKEIEEQRILETQRDKEILEGYIEKILNVFEASNDQDEEDLMVWSLCLFVRENKLECKVSFIENEEDPKRFYAENSFDSQSSFVKLRDQQKVQKAMKELNACKIPAQRKSHIENYFKQEEVKNYFIAKKLRDGQLVIKLKKETDCEK